MITSLLVACSTELTWQMWYVCDLSADSHVYASRHGTEPGPGQPPLAHDEREMMMVKLLLGRVVTMDRDQSEDVKRAAQKLKVPPFVDAQPPLYQDGDGPEKFDTVSGFTQANPTCPKSKVYIVYENGRAVSFIVH